MPRPLAVTRREGFVGSVLFCADCNAIQTITETDSAVIFLSDGTPSTIESYQVFLAAHVHHLLRWLHDASDAQAPPPPRNEDVRDAHKGQA